MKCPYQIKMDCHYVNTSGMTKEKECSNCEFYDNGIRPTGAIIHFKAKKLTDQQVNRYINIVIFLLIAILFVILYFK